MGVIGIAEFGRDHGQTVGLVPGCQLDDSFGGGVQSAAAEHPARCDTDVLDEESLEVRSLTASRALTSATR